MQNPSFLYLSLPWPRLRLLFRACLIAAFSTGSAFGATNLIADPSFEKAKARDQFGHVFAEWGGWKFEGDCDFGIGEVPHSGKTSALLICNSAGKIRLNQPHELQPGRYLITAWIRGLSIGAGAYDNTTEFMFDEKYIPLHKGDTFGWTRLTYVADLAKPTTTGPSFGLWGPGRLWVDDVSLERVNTDVKLTETPLLGAEEAPIAPPSPLGAGSVHCSRCAYRNMPVWKKCYACGATLPEAKAEIAGPAEKLITSFEKGNPFDGGTVVTAHATDGTHALRIDAPIKMGSPQNWDGYDFLSIDTWWDGKDPVPVTIEIQDTGTKDYWTRVNYNAVVPPGKGTVILSLKQLYVGEKGRPGRNLMLGGITRLVLSANPATPSPLFIDRLRLERDLTGPKAAFEGLHAFDFGPADSPVLDGYTAITPGTLYEPGRGYGLKNAKIWRAFNVLQPDPLYQDYICIESGGLAVDVPNGAYRVVLNVDGASGFWGENQLYRSRSILAQGKTVVSEQQDFAGFMKKHYFFWDKDDLPGDNTFDKYNKVHFSEKTFDVNVTNGQLFIEFKGENLANSVSSLVAFPVAKAAQGKRFLDYSTERRRFYFDNGFKRILHRPTGDPLQPTAEDTKHGLVFFQRDLMKEIFYDDTPFRAETGQTLSGDAFPGQVTPMILGIVPLKDLGRVTASIGNLVSQKGAIPASAIEIGYGSYRLSRVSGDGAVYTILPRFVMPGAAMDFPKGVTRPFWFSVHTPPDASPGVYTGKVTLTHSGGEPPVSVPVRFTVRKGPLDAVNIPVGPFGGGISSGWYDSDPAAVAFSAELTAKSLRLLRERGFTLFSGVPQVVYGGFRNGKPVLDFSLADRQMQEARNLGFLAVDSYGAGVSGIDPYFEDTAKMTAAGFSDYSRFIRAVYSAVQQHAREMNWIPVYWNLADEPGGDDLKRSATNAGAYRQAFPKGPPFFTGATSLNAGNDASDPSFLLARNLTIPSLAGYDEPGIRLLRQQGGEWGFYNIVSRWTYGTYLYKAVTGFDLKFRIGWHWNLVAGDPYYALDSREDDSAWVNSGPNGQLIPSIEFARLSAGLDDYRELLTASRLSKTRAGTPAARAAETLIAGRMAAFQLTARDHDALFGIDDWTKFRQQLAAAIEALQ